MLMLELSADVAQHKDALASKQQGEGGIINHI